VVLDVKMPGMDGFEVCRRLRADPSTATIPVLHLSASYLDDHSLVAGLESGADGYLTQPVESPVLLAYVRSLLRVRQMMQSLRQSERSARAVFDGMRDGILLIEPNTLRIKQANAAICQLLGYSADELLELDARDIHPAEAFEEVYKEMVQQHDGEAELATDIPVLCNDGSLLWADISLASVVQQGRPALMAVFRDVTERRTVEAQLAQADRLASLGMLAAGVAHEVNNPLTYVVCNLQSMAEDLRGLGGGHHGERLRDLGRRADESLDGVRRVQSIVRDLNALACTQQERPKPFSLNNAIRSAVTLASNELRFRARLAEDYGELPPLLGNEGRLCQVFLNMLLNAARAIEEGDVDRNAIFVRTSRQGDEVLAEIRDTGRGIPAEDMVRLFDPFYTTKTEGEGMGLGLSICQRIVTGHGGRIEVESELGHGSRFMVRLPVGDGADAPPEPVPEIPRGLMAMSILLVDDEPAILRALGRLLAAYGCEVTPASSGREALELLQRQGEYDCILSDMMMPDVSGMDLYEWMRAHRPELAPRLVLMTGGAFTPRAMRFVERHANAVLDKPIEPESLLAALHSTVERAS